MERVLTRKIYRGQGIGEDAFFCARKYPESSQTYVESEVDLIYMFMSKSIFGEIFRESNAAVFGVCKVLGQQRSEKHEQDKARAVKARFESDRGELEMEMSSLANIHQREKDKRKQLHLGNQNALTIEDELMHVIFQVQHQQLQLEVEAFEQQATDARSVVIETICSSTVQQLVHHVSFQSQLEPSPTDLEFKLTNLDASELQCEKEADEIQRQCEDAISKCHVGIADLEQQRESEHNFLGSEKLKNEIDFQRREEVEAQRLSQTV
eukprot:850355-Rhodomonas_salina.1